MSITLPSVPIVPGINKSVQLPNANMIQSVIVTNKSPYDMVIIGVDASGPRWIPAATEDIFHSLGNNNGQISLSAFNTSALSPSPASNILVTVYFKNDKLPIGSWPHSVVSSTVQATNRMTFSNVTMGLNTPALTINLITGTSTIYLTGFDFSCANDTAVHSFGINISGVVSDNAGSLTYSYNTTVGASPIFIIKNFSPYLVSDPTHVPVQVFVSITSSIGVGPACTLVAYYYCV